MYQLEEGEALVIISLHYFYYYYYIVNVSAIVSKYLCAASVIDP
jgi:hypothetical protein